MPVVAGIIGGTTLAGGVLGNYLAGQQASALAGSNRLSALATLAQGFRAPPEIGDVNYLQYKTPEEYQLAGLITPEQLADTKLANILRNEEARQAQIDVLNQYKDLSQTGLSAIDRAALTEIQNQLAMQEKGQREAILQNMASRGLAGSGSELAANLLASQQASQIASKQGIAQAAQAQQARLNALSNIAQMGQSLESTDFERQAQKAQAQDIINQFNVQNRNVAQAQNLAARQAIQNANIEQANKIAQANIDLQNQAITQNVVNKPLAQYGMQNQYQSGISNAMQNQAAMQGQQAMSQYQTQAGLLGSGLQTGGSLAGMYAMRQPTQTAQPNTLSASQVAQRQQEIGSQYPYLRVER